VVLAIHTIFLAIAHAPARARTDDLDHARTLSELLPLSLVASAPGDKAMRILVIEDDDAVRSAVRRALLLDGYEVHLAPNGQDGLLKAETSVPDAIILDLGLPDIDGMEVCRRLRQRQNRTPILMLTARDAVEDRVDGLEAGADDYLVKPYDVRELQARLHAIMRRHLDGSDGRTLRFADLELDADAHAARIRNRTVDLTRTEYQLLELLMLNPRRVLTSELIYDRIWGYDFGMAGNALRVYIGYLRRKLEADGEPRLIQTVHGVGYVLRES
jgi:two-component system response regulator MprA